MKWILFLLVLLFVSLQYTLWAGDGSMVEVAQLRTAIQAQQAENEQLRTRNSRLEAEVKDLKSGLGAVEERERRELGMIKSGDVFYQFIAPR